MTSTTAVAAGLQPPQAQQKEAPHRHLHHHETTSSELVRRCRACGSSALYVDWAAGDRVCTECGLVDEQGLLEERAEWREFDDDNDLAKNASSAARCGLVATNEQNWVGGLQPTCLSKHVFGGPTKTSALTRKKLVKANQRMDFLMEKMHATDLSNAKLSLQLRRERNKRRMMDPTKLEEEDDDEDNNNNNDTTTRPELELLLVHEEESARTKTAALYADKWSLDRAIRLFGKAHEIEALSSSSSEQQDVLENGLDEPLKNAARDLYAAYTMLNECARRLDLPERIMNEATATMIKYAARRDGLSVRGVSSKLDNNNNNNNNGSKTATEADAASAAKHARQALREYNKLKQMGSLIGAILFYTSRNLCHPRSIVQVCSSLLVPSTMIQSNPHLERLIHTNHHHHAMNASKKKKNPDDNEVEEEGSGGTFFIKKKHCSKAMTEIKLVFPELTRNLSGAAAAANGFSLMFLNKDDTTSTETVLEHVIRKLALPLVAQASIRTLVQHHERQQQQQATSAAAEESLSASSFKTTATTTKKRFVLCAAVTYFVCYVGEIMQNLATQASRDTAMARPVIVATTMTTTTTRDHNNKRRKLVPRAPTTNSTTLSTTTTAPVNGSSLFSEEDDDDDEDEKEEKKAQEQEKAYEMRRVWDAWRDQTPWKRTLNEIERASGVAVMSIESFFKTILYPKRKALLETLKLKSRLSAVEQQQLQREGEEDAMGLNRVPLASVLLPYVTITEPLIKETIPRPKVS